MAIFAFGFIIFSLIQVSEAADRNSDNYLFACALPDVSAQTVISIFGQRLTERYVAPQTFAMISCLSGYSVRSGEVRAYCTADGSWTAPLGSCVRNNPSGSFATVTPRTPPPKCVVPNVRNGYVIADRYRSSYPLLNFDVDCGTHITLSCDPGYEIRGAAEADCLSSGTWSNKLGRCVMSAPVVPLPSTSDSCDVPNVENGLLSINNGPQFEGSGFVAPVYASVAVTCKPGYELIGQQRAACVCKNGWSNPLGSCVEPPPPPIPDVPNGKFLTPQGEGVFGSYVIDRMSIVLCCEVGYTLQGTSRAMCQGGRWSDDFGSCRPIWFWQSTTMKTIPPTTTTMPRPTRQIWQCALPREQFGRFFTVDGEMLTVNHVSSETAVILRCNPGYAAVLGSRSTVCMQGEFFPAPATCVLITGPCQLPSVQNGRFLNGTDIREIRTTMVPDGALVLLQCDPDYSIQGGAARAYCSNSLWTERLGNCLSMTTTTPSATTTRAPRPDPSCALPVVPNGKFVTTEEQDILSVAIISGMMAVLRCNLGFEVFPRTRDRAFCNGFEWTGQFGTCRAIRDIPGPGECGPDRKYKSLDLVNAARSGNTTTVAFLLNSGADPNSQDANGWSGLMWAANNNYTGVINQLLNCNATVDLSNSAGSTALLFAAKAGFIRPFQALLDSGSNPNTTNSFGSTALSFAAQRGQDDIVTALLLKGVNIEAKDNDGSTALMWAVRGNYSDTVQRLLIAGANPNAANNDRMTPLMAASRGGYLQIAWYLLDRGANPNVEDKEGNTALSLADEYGQSDVSDLLLRRGAVRKAALTQPLRMSMVGWG